jgi:nitrogen-specific signal transduction histidine kinase
VIRWIERTIQAQPAARELSELRMVAGLTVAATIAAIQLLRFELAALGDKVMGNGAAPLQNALQRVMAEQSLSLLGAPDAEEIEVKTAAPSAERARSLAHEVRNPLNGAAIHLTFLERQLAHLGADSETVEAAHIIGKEIQRVSELVTNYLDANDITRRTRISLRALCARAVQLAAGDAAAAGIDIHAAEDAPDIALDLELSKIELVLLDLLQHGIERALETKGRVLMCARHDAGEAIIEVRHDAGKAASAAHFNEHYGSGFNVALQVVAEHGGSLKVDSTPTGTTFHLSLPVNGTRKATNS